MAATAVDSKPGTNWKQVTPAHKRKISSIVEHYMHEARPFDACVKDNRKRFGDRAERVCAVVKDMGEKTTKWRKGGKGKRMVEAGSVEVGVVFDEVFAPVLDAADVTVSELAGWVDDAQAAGLLIECRVDPADFTPDQLVEVFAGAQDRVDMLDGLGLPTTGSGARYDLRIVEAAATGSATILRDARRRANANRQRVTGSRQPAASAPANADFESKHRRGPGGTWITMGASGTEVRAIQRRVGAKVDGDFGHRTQARVRAFQKAHGLHVDGIVGRQTVAALRGRTDAARVKVGNLTEHDRSFLRGHIKRTGRKPGSKNRPRVVEAVAIGGLLERVKGLEAGELAMLPDGGAVKHHYTGDGREVWSAGNPSSWRDDGMSWQQARRTPEEAVADALTASAARTDPASLGGASRWGTWATVVVNGKTATFRGVNESGQPLIAYDGKEPVVASWPSLAPAGRLLLEAAFDEAKHPREPDGKFAKLAGDVRSALKRGAPLSERRTLASKVREHGSTMGHAKLTDALHDAPDDTKDIDERVDSALKHGPKKPTTRAISPSTNASNSTAELKKYAVEGTGSVKYQGADPNGAKYRVRKESSAWLVEKDLGGGAWSPNRFVATDAGEKAALGHFLAAMRGGSAGAAREQAGRMGLGPTRDTSGEPSMTPAKLWDKHNRSPRGNSSTVTSAIPSEADAKALATWLTSTRSGTYEAFKATGGGGWFVRGKR